MEVTIEHPMVRLLPILVGLIAVVCGPVEAQDANCIPEVGTSIAEFEARCPGSNASNFIFPDMQSEFGDSLTQEQVKFLHDWREEGFPNVFWGFVTPVDDLRVVKMLGDGKVIAHFIGEITVDCELKSAVWTYGRTGWDDKEMNLYELEATMPAELLPASISVACDK